MPCSRMPKCIVRPYGFPGHMAVWWSSGMNEGWPSIVVRLLSARSAEPPHNSGSAGPIAVRIAPDALRVAMPLASAGNDGSLSVHPSGSSRAASRSNSAMRPGLAPAQAANGTSHSACSIFPRSATWRARLSASSSTGKSTPGSKCRISLVAFTSGTPRAEPCAAPVFCLFGAGQPMMVLSAMSEGASVCSRAARNARYRSGTFSW